MLTIQNVLINFSSAEPMRIVCSDCDRIIFWQRIKALNIVDIQIRWRAFVKNLIGAKPGGIACDNKNSRHHNTE